MRLSASIRSGLVPYHQQSMGREPCHKRRWTLVATATLISPLPQRFLLGIIIWRLPPSIRELSPNLVYRRSSGAPCYLHSDAVPELHSPDHLAQLVTSAKPPLRAYPQGPASHHASRSSAATVSATRSPCPHPTLAASFASACIRSLSWP